MIFDKGAKTVEWERIVSSINGVGENGYSPAIIWIAPVQNYVSPVQKLTDIKDLSVRYETVKFLKEIIGENVMTLKLEMISWKWHQKHRHIAKIDPPPKVILHQT